MILFGVLLIARAGASPPFAEISWSDLPHAARVLAITAAAVALYTTLGFIITMTLMLFVLIALEGRNLFAAAAFSLGISLSPMPCSRSCSSRRWSRACWDSEPWKPSTA